MQVSLHNMRHALVTGFSCLMICDHTSVLRQRVRSLIFSCRHIVVLLTKIAMYARALSKPGLKAALSTQPIADIKVALSILQIAVNFKPNQLLSFRQIPIREFLPYGYSIPDLDRGVRVLEQVHKCLFTTIVDERSNRNKGVLGVTKGPAKPSIRSGVLVIDSKYPYVKVSEARQDILAHRHSGSKKNRVHKLVWNEKLGLYVEGLPRVRYGVRGDRRKLLKLLLNNEVLDRNKIIDTISLSRLSDEREFAFDSAIKGINEMCRNELKLPSDLIVNFPGGYGIDTDRYVIKK